MRYPTRNVDNNMNIVQSSTSVVHIAVIAEFWIENDPDIHNVAKIDGTGYDTSEDAFMATAYEDTI